MNILIPHSWLVEHLDTQAKPEEIQKFVSLCGPSIERIYDREGEPVYDIEVTTNRVDSMSVRGIAREVSVILQQFGIAAQLKPLTIPDPVGSTQSMPLPKIINDSALSKRITCIVLKDVQRTPTPEWMAKRLIQIEQNIHDSVIDITNYVTHELGHPCHAFDYDKVMATGGVIIVKTAQPGKTFVTLDGNQFETVGGEVVFENEQGEIIDLPAIKGTKNTSIDESTKNVLLWIETLDAKKVRFASMTHAIRTVAAQLSEKNVDPELGILVIKRGAELYQQLCQASVGSVLHDEYPGKIALSSVKVRLKTIDTYLGIEIETAVIENILTRLECTVTWEDRDLRESAVLTVSPPSFRPDLSIAADIVEEIARIYGYHNLPSTLMPTAIPTIKPMGTDFSIENRIKQFLADIGWQELYTYSMVSAEIAEQSGFPLNEHLKLQNPLTDDRVYLRRSLVPSLVEVLHSNPQKPQLCVYELAHVYHPQAGSLPEQDHRLTLVAQTGYRQARGVLEALLRQFYTTKLEVKPISELKAELIINSNKIGMITVLGEKLISIDIELSSLLPLLNTHPKYQPLPKAAALTEDLTFTLPVGTPVGTVIDQVKEMDPLISNVELLDVYERNHTLRITYLHPNQAVSSAEVEPVRKQIVSAILNQFAGQLVGSLN